MRRKTPPLAELAARAYTFHSPDPHRRKNESTLANNAHPAGLLSSLQLLLNPRRCVARASQPKGRLQPRRKKPRIASRGFLRRGCRRPLGWEAKSLEKQYEAFL